MNEQLLVATRKGGFLNKSQKIIQYLLKTPEGATPKQISFATGINNNTVKSMLPKLENIRNVTRGWYKVVNGGDGLFSSGGDLLTDWNFHNCILTHQITDFKLDKRSSDFDFGLITAHLSISSTGKATFRIACDHPLNVSSLCLAFGYFKLFC